ncbi:PE-PPE domain-containing protein [Mycolicibacterium chubuense NBB4]|uniref:PE-PPE domain-containing protein n=1 Tax=Mycolicibacterium chubuense (strain NBB4) TaxID=710421 RepID=I4BJT6_MYCCN|nr:PE-PPE domain-containing protein [Mycolicibacterium chubuense]AFM17543.1 PE-PPE domain-containing protein [Mycolicibacterium chubuense NBB4]
MKRATKEAMIAAALPVAVLPLALCAAVPGAAAAGLIPDGPATVLHHSPTPFSMPHNLGGAVCAAPKVCREVFHSWIDPLGLSESGVDQNVARLDQAIRSTDGKKIVFAFSGGARDASVWLEDHAGDADAPKPEDLSFILLGNGGRKYGGINTWWYGDQRATPTDTQYDVLDVAREYDPVADFPQDPYNLLALANAAAAFGYVHMRYDQVNLDDPDNIVWTEGKTTYVFVPTEHLPLLQGFYDVGLGWMVQNVEPKLRDEVDTAYDRTWLEGKSPQGAPTPAASQEQPSSPSAAMIRSSVPTKQSRGDTPSGTSQDTVSDTGRAPHTARSAAPGTAPDADSAVDTADGNGDTSAAGDEDAPAGTAEKQPADTESQPEPADSAGDEAGADSPADAASRHPVSSSGQDSAEPQRHATTRRVQKPDRSPAQSTSAASTSTSRSSDRGSGTHSGSDD